MGSTRIVDFFIDSAPIFISFFFFWVDELWEILFLLVVQTLVFFSFGG